MQEEMLETMPLVRMTHKVASFMPNHMTNIHASYMLLFAAFTDYAPVQLVLLFNEATSVITVDIVVLNDNVVEGNEAFTVELSSLVNPFIEIMPATATVTILDNDGKL